MSKRDRARDQKLAAAIVAEIERTFPNPPFNPTDVILGLLSSRNSAELEGLNDDAEAHFADLKAAYTTERENALRNLTSVQDSTLPAARIFQSTPQFLDVFPKIPMMWKVRALIDKLDTQEEVDGYSDAYWMVGRAVLWIVTRDRWAINSASGSGPIEEGLRAADVMDWLNLRRQQVQDAANKLRQLCLNGSVKTLEKNDPITATDWLRLNIMVEGGWHLAIREVDDDAGELHAATAASDHHDASIPMAVYSRIVFSRDDLLREFSPAVTRVVLADEDQVDAVAGVSAADVGGQYPRPDMEVRADIAEDLPALGVALPVAVELAEHAGVHVGRQVDGAAVGNAETSAKIKRQEGQPRQDVGKVLVRAIYERFGDNIPSEEELPLSLFMKELQLPRGLSNPARKTYRKYRDECRAGKWRNPLLTADKERAGDPPEK